jgi:phage regulator Rha-like protein
MKNLIEINKNELIITSKMIADGVNNKHKNVIQLIENHFERIKKIRGILPFETEKKSTNNWKIERRGRPSKFYLLNEVQASFLISLMDNSEEVLDFKQYLVKEFYRMRRALLQVELNKQNKEWLESREKGKETRKKVAKEYENYLKYAIENGSKTYEKKPQLAYSQFTNMINKSLFDFEFKPKAGTTRNYMTKDQLDIVNSAEILTQKIIQQEIDKGTEYHEIFKTTKAKIKTYAELSGKSKIIDILVNNQIDMLNLLK